MLRISFTSDFSFQIALQNLSNLKLPFSFSQESEGEGAGREGYLMSCQLLRQMARSFCLYYQTDCFSMLLALLCFTGDEFISLRMPIVSAICVHLSRGELLFQGIFEISSSFAMGVSMCQKGWISTGARCSSVTCSVCQNLVMVLVKLLICWLIDSSLGDRSTLLIPIKADSSTLLSSLFLIAQICLPISNAIFVIISLCYISSAQICVLKLQNSFFILLIAYQLISFACFSNLLSALGAFAAFLGVSLSRFLRISDSLEARLGWIGNPLLGPSGNWTESVRQLEENSGLLSRLLGVNTCGCELLFLIRLSFSLEAWKACDSLELLLSGENLSGRRVLLSLMDSSLGQTLLLSDIFQECCIFLQESMRLTMVADNNAKKAAALKWRVG